MVKNPIKSSYINDGMGICYHLNNEILSMVIHSGYEDSGIAVEIHNPCKRVM